MVYGREEGKREGREGRVGKKGRDRGSFSVFKKGLENTLIHNTQSLENLITLIKVIFCLSVCFLMSNLPQAFPLRGWDYGMNTIGVL